MGSPGQAPGAVAERYVAPADCCVAIPDSMSLDEAMLVEPLSIGLHAVRLSQLAAGMKLAILGAGPIGLSVLLCAKATARAPPGDRSPGQTPGGRPAVRCRRRLESAAGDVVAAVAQAEPQGLDLVFECSGDPACVEQGQSLLRPGGALMLVGIPPVDSVAFDPHCMRRFELRFQAVRRQNECVLPVIRLITGRRLDPAAALDPSLPAPRDFRRLRTRGWLSRRRDQSRGGRERLKASFLVFKKGIAPCFSLLPTCLPAVGGVKACHVALPCSQLPALLPAFTAARRSSRTRRNGRRACRTAGKRRSWSWAFVPGHRRSGQ